MWRLKWFIASLITGLLITTSCFSQPDVKITFQVIAPTLAETDSIFIVGNQPQLADWQPGQIPLQYQSERTWSTTLSFISGVDVEYKFTRGGWNTQAVDETNRMYGNFVLADVWRDTTVVFTAPNWADLVESTGYQITGTVKYHKALTGDGILPRDVIVWLPPSYQSAVTKRYPVLYMHDGQNIIDPATSFVGIDWQVDETADSLIARGKMEEIIIVGINNSTERSADYSDSPNGRAYMNFLVHDLKPMIDATYRTLPDREHTATMGSSMGGLIAFLIVWYHPDVFSMAGCLSPALKIDTYDAVSLVEKYDGPDKKIKVYLDNGTVDLEAMLQPGCDAMLAALQKKGFTLDDNLRWYLDNGGIHSETDWAKRLWRPLLFMFGK